MAVLRRRISVRNEPVFIKAAEMINTKHIIQLIAIGDPLHPPRITGLLMITPVVERITP